MPENIDVTHYVKSGGMEQMAETHALSPVRPKGEEEKAPVYICFDDQKPDEIGKLSDE